MAISYIGSATGTNTATLPAHAAGDLILVFAYRDGSNTAPTLVSGFTNISLSGGNTTSSRIAYKVAASSSETVGTWTNATSVIAAVYRGVDNTTPIGGFAGGGALSTTVAYNAVTMTNTSGSSWIVGVAGHRSVNTALETPPSGMTARTSVLDATDEAALHDTNGGVTSWPTTTVSVGGTSSGWRSWAVELLAYVPPPPTSYTNCYANAWFAGNASSPSNANGAADGVFTDNTGNTTWYGQWDMDNPPAALGSRTQTVEVTCRVSQSGGTAYLDSVDIYYDNVLKGAATLSGSNTVTSTTGQVVTFTFPGSLLPATDLAQIGLYAVGSAGTVQVDSIKWIAAHDETVNLTTINFSLNQSESWGGSAVRSRKVNTTIAETAGYTLNARRTRGIATTTSEVESITSVIERLKTLSTSISETETWAFGTFAKRKDLTAVIAELQAISSSLGRLRTTATTLVESENLTLIQARVRNLSATITQTQSWFATATVASQTIAEITTSLVQLQVWLTTLARLRVIDIELNETQTVNTAITRVIDIDTELNELVSHNIALSRNRALQTTNTAATTHTSNGVRSRDATTTHTLVQNYTFTPARTRNIETVYEQTQSYVFDTEERQSAIQKLFGGVIYGSGQTPHVGVDTHKQDREQQYQLGTVYVYFNDHYVYVRSAIAIAPGTECDILSQFIAFPGTGFTHDLDHTVDPGNYFWIRAVDSPLH